jgi:hypothetical protein
MKLTVVYTVPVGSYGSVLVCMKHITLTKRRGFEETINARGIDMSQVVLVFPGHMESIESDWSQLAHDTLKDQCA